MNDIPIYQENVLNTVNDYHIYESNVKILPCILYTMKFGSMLSKKRLHNNCLCLFQSMFQCE